MWTSKSLIDRQSQLFYSARCGSPDQHDLTVLFISHKNVVVAGHGQTCWIRRLSNIGQLRLSVLLFQSPVCSDDADDTRRPVMADRIVARVQLDGMPRSELQRYFSDSASMSCILLQFVNRCYQQIVSCVQRQARGTTDHFFIALRLLPFSFTRRTLLANL